jgi:hypothetical protein
MNIKYSLIYKARWLDILMIMVACLALYNLPKTETTCYQWRASHDNWSCYANKSASKYISKVWIMQIIKNLHIARHVAMASSSLRVTYAYACMESFLTAPRGKLSRGFGIEWIPEKKEGKQFQLNIHWLILWIFPDRGRNYSCSPNESEEQGWKIFFLSGNLGWSLEIFCKICNVTVTKITKQMHNYCIFCTLAITGFRLVFVCSYCTSQ